MRRRGQLAIVTGILAVVGAVAYAITYTAALPAYVVPSFYQSTSSVGSAGGCSDLSVGGGGFWSGGVDANNVFSVLHESNNPRAGTFTITWGGNTTGNIAYNDTFSDILTQIQGLTGLSGVTLVPDSEMPDGQTNDPTETLDADDPWFLGVPDPDSTPLVVDDSNIVSGHVKSQTTGLIDVIRQLPTGTEVDFATNGCYEVDSGLDIFDGGPAITYNGNAGTYQPGENAELYNPSSAGDGSVIQETGDGGTSPPTPATIEHLNLKGHDPSGTYDNSISDDSSGIMLQGTTYDTVNDVFVHQVWGDGITIQPTPGNAINLNTTVENVSINTVGRVGISPISVNGLLVCGVSIGSAGLGNDSFDFENDFIGPTQFAKNVIVTGAQCTNTDAATGTTVTAAGCFYSGLTVVNNDFLHEGPILINDCTGTQEGAGGGAILVEPGGAEVTGDPNQQNGPVIFSKDQVTCPATAYQACVDVTGPWNVQLKGSTVLVGSAGIPQDPWNAADAFIPVDPTVAVPSGVSVRFSYQERNTGSDPLENITVTGSFCGTANWASGGSTGGNSPSMSPPDNELLPGGEWTYNCVATNVTSTETDTGNATGTDVTTMTTVPLETSSGTIQIIGSTTPGTTTTQAPTGTSNLNESVSVKFGSRLYLGSDCLTGDLTGSAPYYSSPAAFSFFSAISTVFFDANRKQCPLRAEISSAPSATSVSVGTPVTDTATITGASGAFQPVGSLSFYVCGQTSEPQACTSTTNSLGSSSLTTIGGSTGITSDATSSSFTPSAPGVYCFAVYYSQTGFSGGGAGYYENASDQSGVTTAVVPGGVPGLPYDGCFTAS